MCVFVRIFVWVFLWFFFRGEWLTLVGVLPFCQDIECINTVVAVMTMGNIVPRVGIELTSLAFQASVLTTTPLYPRLLFCAALA